MSPSLRLCNNDGHLVMERRTPGVLEAEYSVSIRRSQFCLLFEGPGSARS